MSIFLSASVDLSLPGVNPLSCFTTLVSFILLTVYFIVYSYFSSFRAFLSSSRDFIFLSSSLLSSLNTVFSPARNFSCYSALDIATKVVISLENRNSSLTVFSLMTDRFLSILFSDTSTSSNTILWNLVFTLSRMLPPSITLFGYGFGTLTTVLFCYRNGSTNFDVFACFSLLG